MSDQVILQHNRYVHATGTASHQHNILEKPETERERERERERESERDEDKAADGRTNYN